MADETLEAITPTAPTDTDEFPRSENGAGPWAASTWAQIKTQLAADGYANLVTAPTAHTDPGQAGDIAISGNVFYWYVAGVGWLYVVGSSNFPPP